MKSAALLFVLVFLLAGTGPAQAQAFRGAAAASGRSGTVFVAPGAAGGQAVQRSPTFRGSSVSPPVQSFPRFQSPSYLPPPNAIQNQRGRGVFVPPPVVGRGGTFVGRGATFILGGVPHHPHRHWFFHRHPGILFFDVPFVVGTPVISQIAPGVITDRRYLDRPPSEAGMRDPGQLAPFDPTPQEVVERMLALAVVKRGDVIYDLGSGDGRILIAAAKKYGVRGVGFEIDPGLVKLARENARKQGVEKLVEIRQQDFLTADLSPATVVTLYLSQDGNLAVRQHLMNQLKSGARVVSYTFDMGDWQPKIAENYRDAGGETHVIYLWEVGGPVVYGKNVSEILQPQSMRNGPLVIDVE